MVLPDCSPRKTSLNFLRGFDIWAMLEDIERGVEGVDKDRC